MSLNVAGYYLNPAKYSVSFYDAGIASASRALLIDLDDADYPHTNGQRIILHQVNISVVVAAGSTAHIKIGVVEGQTLTASNIQWIEHFLAVGDASTNSDDLFFRITGPIDCRYDSTTFETLYAVSNEESAGQTWAGPSVGNLKNAIGDTDSSPGTGDVVLEILGVVSNIAVTTLYHTE